MPWQCKIGIENERRLICTYSYTRQLRARNLTVNILGIQVAYVYSISAHHAYDTITSSGYTILQNYGITEIINNKPLIPHRDNLSGSRSAKRLCYVRYLHTDKSAKYTRSSRSQSAIIHIIQYLESIHISIPISVSFCVTPGSPHFSSFRRHRRSSGTFLPRTVYI